jgi:alkylated DNA repair dioxygenase AlkB
MSAGVQPAPSDAQTGLPGADRWPSSPNWPEGCHYHPEFVREQDASQLLQRLWQDLPWQQRTIRLFGREVMQPRLICWQSDPGLTYSYSGLRLDPAAWHPELRKLRRRLGEDFGLEFNSVLANAYRDGQDSMGWHADDEPELGPKPTIASVSLGAARIFRWREKSSGQSAGLEMQPGSLLVLGGDFQQRFQHSVPKTARPIGLRINLTFRKVLSLLPGG